MKPQFSRVLLKLSGEGLAGEAKSGIDMATVQKLAGEIAELQRMQVQVCLVIGGGNFFRGAKNAGEHMDRSVADQVGMMATVMNAMIVKSALESINVPATVFSGLIMPQVCEAYSYRQAMAAVNRGEVVIFAGGTGSPYFTTDTGAALRATEMHCEALLKATQVDGVYDADPRVEPNAKRYDSISYDEVLHKHLNVMDMTAISMMRDNKIPVIIFAQKEENALIKAVCGKIRHTIIQ